MTLVSADILTMQGQVEFNSNGSRVQDAIKVLQYRHNSGKGVKYLDLNPSVETM